MPFQLSKKLDHSTYFVVLNNILQTFADTRGPNRYRKVYNTISCSYCKSLVKSGSVNEPINILLYSSPVYGSNRNGIGNFDFTIPP